MAKSIEEQYKVLDEIDHIRKRPGMYIGSITTHIGEEWTYDELEQKMKFESISYNPGLFKIFSEILDNSIDEHKRPESGLDTIKVEIDKDSGELSVWDNGGIPVVKHSGENEYVPTLVFSKLRAGSNFNDEDDQSIIGTNGVGSALCNVMSTKFTIETADGQNKFKQTFSENMRKFTEPSITETKKAYTKISFIPDYEYFKTEIGEEGLLKKIVKRVYDCAGCNPDIKFYLNGQQIRIKSFGEYCNLYFDDVISEENNDWHIAVGPTNNGFQQISFVNSVDTYDGGNHVNYIVDQITMKLREFFKKKHRVDVKPSDIRNHLSLFISANINRPMFSSQTKSKMISEVKDFKSSIDISDKFIRKVIKSPIIQDILDWVEAKKRADELAALRKLNKENTKTNPRRIAKFTDASEKKDRKNCMLFLTEGDSAASTIQAARNPKTMGVYPLKGKPINVHGIDPKKLINNNEFKELITIMGLQIGVPVKRKEDLYFGDIVILSDQDLDGLHIRALLINMLYTFWPELFELGCVHMFITPVIKAQKGKVEKWFYSESEFEEFKSINDMKGWSSKWYKGLGTSKTKEFVQYLDNIENHLIPLVIEDDKDRDSIDLAFNSTRANDRKEWLDIQ